MMHKDNTSFDTLKVEITNNICRVRFNRPEADNTINAQMVRDFDALLQTCEDKSSAITILILEGAKDVFCAGGDFKATAEAPTAEDPEKLYGVWYRLATGPFLTISVVEGRANAGGVGFIVASDIVLASEAATFGLSELLFGLFPACVMPFLVRRIGFQKAHYLTLMTRPIGTIEAANWGLVDATSDQVDITLRQHLSRLKYLDKAAIANYKAYMAKGTDILKSWKPDALTANRKMFNDPSIQANIKRYVTELKFPWEA
ncbi:MAG: enoyl-CoA hydratase/isomerase [Kordiimonadaceae bacterium]|nr:enoyl-CoA hydratase/isomerase [Kordiimonadaceae bacterium]